MVNLCQIEIEWWETKIHAIKRGFQPFLVNYTLIKVGYTKTLKSVGGFGKFKNDRLLCKLELGKTISYVF